MPFANVLVLARRNRVGGQLKKWGLFGPPLPRMIGWIQSLISSMSPLSIKVRDTGPSPYCTISIPGCCLNAATSATRSLPMTVVLFQEGFRRVEEATYFRIELMRSETLSPERVGQAAANASYVRRPMRRASQL